MDKTFVRFPVDSVILCAESVGIQPSQEVACGMVEDVSFRIRQLTDVSLTTFRFAQTIDVLGRHVRLQVNLCDIPRGGSLLEMILTKR